MTPEQCVAQLKFTKEFFDRATRCLEEKHGGYVPAEGMFTTAQQVAHVAQIIDWFVEGASRPEGFDMNFDAHILALNDVNSLAQARDWFDRSVAAAVKWVESKNAEELGKPLPDGPIMGGMPRYVIISSIDEHTAHHRGALGVYARLQGLVPAMPYMETETAN